METILADHAVSSTELSHNFANILSEAKGKPVVILNHDKPEAYLLSAKHYRDLLQTLKDAKSRSITRGINTNVFITIPYGTAVSKDGSSSTALR